MLEDDNKGVSENLNETEADGLGLRVSARYYMQIHDVVKGKSLQRERQVAAQSPLQYFFIFDYNQADQYQVLKSVPISLHKVQHSTINYRLTPVAKNQIMMRIENLAD